MAEPVKPTDLDDIDVDFQGTVNVVMDTRLHQLMKELASRKGVNIGRMYEQALKEFLSKIENYMGQNNKITKGRSLKKIK